MTTININQILGPDGKYHLTLSATELCEINYAVEKTNKAREQSRAYYAKKRSKDTAREPSVSNKPIAARLKIIIPEQCISTVIDVPQPAPILPISQVRYSNTPQVVHPQLSTSIVREPPNVPILN